MYLRKSVPFFSLLLTIISVTFFCCKEDPKDSPPVVDPTPKAVVIPAFNADSAYVYIEKQVNFGPRVMGSEGHQVCQNWLVEKFKSFGATVKEQNFEAKVYTGKTYPATNIIASFNTNASERVLLAAHWDTRHIADSPLSTERQKEAILGADDGGSGVGVLLEIARQLQAQNVEIGIDLVLFDAEDYGEAGGDGDTYCLGSQYWSRNVQAKDKAKFGILLDMVGAKNAQFPVEGTSFQYARPIVEKVWNLAKRMGKANYFPYKNGGSITDDHYYVNRIAGIPMIDIINLSGTEGVAFGAHWHTHNDDMDVIDKNTLRAVGQVLLAVIYREDAGQF